MRIAGLAKGKRLQRVGPLAATATAATLARPFGLLSRARRRSSAAKCALNLSRIVRRGHEVVGNVLRARRR